MPEDADHYRKCHRAPPAHETGQRRQAAATLAGPVLHRDWPCPRSSGTRRLVGGAHRHGVAALARCLCCGWLGQHAPLPSPAASSPQPPHADGLHRCKSASKTRMALRATPNCVPGWPSSIRCTCRTPGSMQSCGGNSARSPNARGRPMQKKSRRHEPVSNGPPNHLASSTRTLPLQARRSKYLPKMKAAWVCSRSSDGGSPPVGCNLSPP